MGGLCTCSPRNAEASSVTDCIGYNVQLMGGPLPPSHGAAFHPRRRSFIVRQRGFWRERLVRF